MKKQHFWVSTIVPHIYVHVLKPEVQPEVQLLQNMQLANQKITLSNMCGYKNSQPFVVMSQRIIFFAFFVWETEFHQ